MPAELVEARARFERRWDRLRSDATEEVAVRWRRPGWAVLALAFCAGLAVAGRGRRKVKRPVEAS